MKKKSYRKNGFQINAVVVAIHTVNFRKIELAGIREHDAIPMEELMQDLTEYIVFYQIIENGRSVITHYAKITDFKQNGKKWIILFEKLTKLKNPIYYTPGCRVYTQGHEFTNLDHLLSSNNLKDALCRR